MNTKNKRIKDLENEVEGLRFKLNQLELKFFKETHPLTGTVWFLDEELNKHSGRILFENINHRVVKNIHGKAFSEINPNPNTYDIRVLSTCTRAYFETYTIPVNSIFKTERKLDETMAKKFCKKVEK